jgi:zinc-ribbon domain
MYCPKCGQQQVSDDARFCPRCGFPAVGVRELLHAGGILPALDREWKKPRRSPRREGVRQGVLLFFACLILLPLSDAIGNNRLDFLGPMLAIAGLVRILYAVFFQEGAPRKKRRDGSPPDAASSTTGELDAAARGAALPPARSVPASGWRQQTDTAEMVERPSVTEHTTRLLDEPGERR